MINYNASANDAAVATSACAAQARGAQERESGCEKFACCSGIVVGFLAALLLFTIGLILGAVYSETILASLAAAVVFAVVLAVLIAVVLIFNKCICARRCRCRFDDCCR